MNPVFKREIQQYLRKPKTFLLVLAQIIILSGILLLLWPRYDVFSMVNERGKQLFSVFLMTNLSLVILITPTFTATSVTYEKEKGTFNMLFTSLLTPIQILFGKLFASLSVLLFVVISAAPITAICSLSGGISLTLLLKAYCIILAAALTYGMFGLAVSSICNRSFTANMAGYLGVAFLVGATWLPSMLLSQFFFLKDILSFVALLSPIRSMYALIYPEQYAIATHAYSSNIPPIVLHLAGMATLSFIFFLTFSFFIFRKTTGQAGKNQEAYTGLEKTIKRKLTFPFYLIDPLKRKKPIGRFRNPVFITELRSKLFGKPKFILRGLALSIIISMCILLLVSTQYGDSLKADYVRMVAVIFQIAMIALLAPAVSSGSITNELTSGTFLLLRTSTISSITVVTGKLKAAFLYVMIFLVSSLPVFLALAYLESTSSYWRVGAWVGVLVIAAILFICAGLFFSSICTKTEVATALSYGFAALICVVTLGGITFSSQLTPYAQTVMLTLNPIVAALQITSDKMFADLPLIMNNPLWQNYLILTGILCIILTLFSAIRVHHIFRKRN